MALNVNPDDLDNRLISGDLDVAVEGSGVGPGRPRAGSSPIHAPGQHRLGAGRALWYTRSARASPPLDNVHCRKAVLLAADRTGYQRAYGGATGGDIATNLLPPVIPGAAAVRPLPDAGQRGRPC